MNTENQMQAAGEHVAHITDNAYESIRSLNHITRGVDLYVPDVYRVLANLQALAGGLPQALEQLTKALERALQGRNLGVDDGAHQGDPFAAITAAAGALDQARISAGQLTQSLKAAQQALAWVSEAD